MFRTLMCVTVLVMIAPLVCSAGYISNQTLIGDLIINGGANVSKLNNNILNVCPEGCNYSSIQFAIHSAVPWSVIEIQSGSYDESLNITKPLFFKSVGGGVDFEGTIMPFHYPVTFSQGNHFASVDLNSPPWHRRCEICGSYEQFSKCYQEIIKAAPSNANIWRDYAVDQKEIWQKYEDALASVDRALQIDPRFSEVWEIKGVILNNLGRYQDAIFCCERAIELDRFDDSAWTEKGYAFGQMKSYDESLRCFETALAINPQKFSAWESKGYILCLLGKFEKSYQAYDVAISINPMNAQSWNNKGYCLDKLGRYDEALFAYDEAIRIDPDYISAWNNKGATLQRLSRFAEADAAFAKAKELGYVG